MSFTSSKYTSGQYSVLDGMREVDVTSWSPCVFIREEPANQSAIQGPWKEVQSKPKGVASGWRWASIRENPFSLSGMSTAPVIKNEYWGLPNSGNGRPQQCLHEPYLGPGVTAGSHLVALKDTRDQRVRRSDKTPGHEALAFTNFGHLSTKATQERSEQGGDNPCGIQRKNLPFC